MTSAALRAVIDAPLFRAFLCLSIALSAPGASLAEAQAAPQLSGVAFRTVAIAGCQAAILDVGLTRQAPKGGTQVLLTSSTPALALPPSVLVPKGASVVSVPVVSKAVTAETVATARATLGSQSMPAQIRLRPIGVAALTFNQSSVMGGDVVRATIALECPAGSGGVTVSVSSNNPRAVGPVVPQFTVPPGASSGVVNVVTSGVPATIHQLLTATPLSGGLAKSAELVTNVSTNTRGEACSTDDRPGRTSVVPGVTTQAAGRFACKWQRNNLTVAFLNGDDVQRSKVMTTVRQWEASGYMLSFVDDLASADIRVEFDANPDHLNSGSSNIGMCRSKAPERTMLLGVSSDPVDPNQRVILHEFGHALGLVHEHQNPAFAVEWNMAGIKNHYFTEDPSTQEDRIRDNIIARADATNYSAFDVNSIMRYKIYPDMVANAAEIVARYGDQIFADRPTTLSLMDTQFVARWRTIQWDGYVSAEDQYLIGNWDGGRVFGVAGDKLSVRRGNCVLMAWNHDDQHDFGVCLGNGNAETQYASGDWDGDGRASLLVRRGNEYIVDANGDAVADYSMTFGNHDDRMLVGDWDGDGDDNVAVVRGNVVYVDYDWDGLANTWFAYGNAGERMIAGDWDGNGVEDVAIVRPGVGILLNWNRDGAADQVVQFGDYTDYVVAGDWNGDGRDEVGVMRGNCLLMDYNLSGGAAEKSYCYGNGAPTKVIQNY